MDNEKRIVRLCDNVYLAGGAIIEATDKNMFQDDAGQAELLALGRSSATSRFVPRPHGFLTVHGYGFNIDPAVPNSKYVATTMYHAKNLPEQAKEALSKEMPEHAGEI